MRLTINFLQDIMSTKGVAYLVIYKPTQITQVMTYVHAIFAFLFLYLAPDPQLLEAQNDVDRIRSIIHSLGFHSKVALKEKRRNELLVIIKCSMSEESILAHVGAPMKK